MSIEILTPPPSQALPLGSVVHSMLTLAQFQAVMGTGWVLANGQSVTGSKYATLTGATTVPDMRSTFLRGKDNGRGLNPDGDTALGAYAGDKYLNHSHTASSSSSFSGSVTGTVPTGASAGTGAVQRDVVATGTVPISASVSGTVSTSTTVNASTSGGNETAPKSIIVNIFIRIN